MLKEEQGFTHLLLTLTIGVFVLALVASFIPVNRHYNDGKSNVAGVALVKDYKAMEQSTNSAEIKIATDAGQTAVVNQRVGALSNFPLTVNPQTKELTVSTPAGTKVVTVLPQKAVNNMLASKVMDDVISEKVDNSLASVPNMVKLETKNGVLGYVIKGTKTHKLLGFIPIKTAVEAFVSAENGQVVETNQSLLGRILSKIAP